MRRGSNIVEESLFIENNNTDHVDNEQISTDETTSREDAASRGDKTNDAVLAASLATESHDEAEWLKEHEPALHEEMKGYGVPFDPDEFNKQGFAFEKNKQGETHVLFPTPEYAEWLEKPEDERGSRPTVHHETIADKATRSWMDDRMNEVDQVISEELSNILKGCTWEERRDILKNVESYQEKLQNGVDIEDAYQYEIKELAKGNIPVKESDNKSIEINQEKIWNDAEKNALNSLAHDENTPYHESPLKRGWTEEERRKYYLNQLTEEIKNQLWDDYQTKNTGKISEELKNFNATEQASEIAKQAIIDSLAEGRYFEYNKSVKLSDMFLGLYGVDKNEPGIIKAAWNSADKNDRFFGMSDRVVEQALSSEEYPIEYDFRSHSTHMAGEKRSNSFLDVFRKQKFDKKVTDKLEKKVSERVESLGIRQETEYVDILEKSKKASAERFYNAIKESTDLSSCLEKRTVGIDVSDIKNYLGEKYGPAFREFGATPLTNNEVAEIDQNRLKEQLRKRFVDILEIGAESYTPDFDKKHTDYYVTRAFNSKDLARVEQNLNLDLSSPEVFEKSIYGFLNTLQGVNGENSKQANWYYESIFANNPDEFYSRMMDLKKDKDFPRGLKTKITRFMNENKSFQEYEQARMFEKMTREAERKQRSVGYRSIMRNASGEDIDALIRKRQLELVNEIKEAGTEEIDTFDETSIKPETESNEKEADKERWFKTERVKNFGVRKVEMMKAWKEHIESTYFYDASEDKKPEFFIDTFPVVGADNGKLDNVILDDDLSYVGFQFEYEGNLCVIAESFNTEAGMYLFRGKPGDNFKEMFDGTKAEALQDPRVVRIEHLDRENMEDSIDLTYQKAFLYLRTGDKNIVHYNVFGDNGRRDWREYQKIEYPAWPMSIEKEEIDPEELERYKQWQQSQE